MSNAPGYEAVVPPAERRAFFDLRRRLNIVEGMLGLGGGTGVPAALDEVFIGPNAPLAPENYELWYDPDAGGTTFNVETVSTVLASQTITATPTLVASQSLGTAPYRRLVHVQAHMLLGVNATAAYVNIHVGVAGFTKRIFRTNQVDTTCTLIGATFLIVPAGTAAVAEVHVSTNASSVCVTAGSTDYNVMSTYAMPVAG